MRFNAIFNLKLKKSLNCHPDRAPKSDMRLTVPLKFTVRRTIYKSLKITY